MCNVIYRSMSLCSSNEVECFLFTLTPEYVLPWLQYCTINMCVFPVQVKTSAKAIRAPKVTQSYASMCLPAVLRIVCVCIIISSFKQLTFFSFLHGYKILGHTAIPGNILHAMPELIRITTPSDGSVELSHLLSPRDYRKQYNIYGNKDRGN